MLSGLFEARKIGEPGGAGLAPTVIATLLAFVVGYASIAWMLRWLTSHSTAIFVIYRVALGTLGHRSHGGRRHLVAFVGRWPSVSVSAYPPSAFRLPVEKIREGYYSDAYFNLTKSLLEADGHHPRVLMQVFQRKDSILGGIDEAIAVLKQGAGPLRGRSLGQRLREPRRARAARGRRDLPVGDA